MDNTLYEATVITPHTRFERIHAHLDEAKQWCLEHPKRSGDCDDELVIYELTQDPDTLWYAYVSHWWLPWGEWDTGIL